MQATMRRQNLTNLLEGSERGGGPTNKRFANDIRVALRLELNPNGEVGMCLRRYRTGASQGGSRK
eukprot:1634619-Pyramimonas_sp.AAC.1